MNRKEFFKRVKSGPPMLLDGATGSNLMKMGMGGGVCPEEWILEHPKVMTDLQASYVKSGSEVVTAPTFGANRNSLKRYRLENETARLNRELLALTKSAVGKNALTAADISPTGLFLRPFGEAGFDDLYAIFSEQAEVLRDAGADLFLIETQMNLAETRIALLAVRDACPDLPIITTVTVDSMGLTMSGNPAGAAFLVLSSLGADSVGLNCSVGPDLMLEILRLNAEYSYSPLTAKANAGNPHGEGGDMVFDVCRESFAEEAFKAAGLGVRIIGGCCGTDPEYIAKIREKTSALTGLEYKTPDFDKLARLAANEKRVFEIDPESCPPPEKITISPDLEDDLSDALEDESEFLRLYINNPSDADFLCEAAYLIDRPVILGGADKAALGELLKKYPGRAVLDPECDFPGIGDLIEKYNPVILKKDV